MSDFNSNNDFSTNREITKSKFNSTLFVIGIGLVFLGCLLLLENIANYPFRIRVISFWPIIIVALGAVKLIEGKFRCLSGWIITTLGLLLLAHTIMGRPLHSLIRPAITGFVGMFIVMYTLKRQRKGFAAKLQKSELQKSEDFVRGTAILGGSEYKPSDGQFDGAELTAIFGGFVLDLRKTTMKHDSARVDVSVMAGGIEIRIPESWDVSVNVSAVAGGVENKTPGSPAADSPKLLITGSVLFGGVSVKSGHGK